jgi:hypothetical protein
MKWPPGTLPGVVARCREQLQIQEGNATMGIKLGD